MGALVCRKAAWAELTVQVTSVVSITKPDVRFIKKDSAMEAGLP